MTQTQMLQAILDNQADFRSQLKQIEERLGGKIDSVEKRLDSVEKNLSKQIKTNSQRLNMIGKQLAYLEDDAPTTEDFKNLESRVTQIEHQLMA